MVLNASAAVLAFDVGGTSLKAEVLADDLSSLASTSAATPRGPALVDGLADVAATLLDGLHPEIRATVRAAGLAIPGIVDAERGIGVYAANVGLEETPIAGPLSDRIGLPVALGHDVTAAADAERRHGAAADIVDPVVVAIGTGIAAVSYVHGRRVAGVTGQAGELGHLVVRATGPVCGCGARGCLEAVASAAAVARRYRELSGREVEGAREVVARLGADTAADQAWQEAIAGLADGLSAAVALLAPGAVVLGGGLAGAGAALLNPLEARMRSAARALAVPPLLLAKLGSRAGVVGAGLLALDLHPMGRPSQPLVEQSQRS